MNDNAELFAAVRKMKRMGTLEAATTHGNLLSEDGNKILARFTLAVLEQRSIGCPYNDSEPVYALPAVPQPTRVKIPAKVNVKMGGDKTTRAMFQGMNMMHEDFVKALLAAGVEVEE